MINESAGIGGFFGTFLSAVGVTLSINEIQAIISIIVTIIGFLITLTTAIIIPVIKKIKAARKDGKITGEELEDIKNTLEKGQNELKK